MSKPISQKPRNENIGVKITGYNSIVEKQVSIQEDYKNITIKSSSYITKGLGDKNSLIITKLFENKQMNIDDLINIISILLSWK